MVEVRWTETYHQADKLARQLRYALRKGIPYVWFPGGAESGGRGGHEVKDLTAAVQGPADPDTWRPAVTTSNQP
ncbi:hypothetical protein [Embleya sp. MST-111070]|uniref:hypothetical protein n=1 Tax=Embleya sp. MST-111070 TaxID=3398231 RepID=UPI003F733804